MEINFMHSLILVVMASIVTFITRIIPFALFGGGKGIPKKVEYLGDILPAAIIATLVIYCLRNINFETPVNFVPGIVATASVIIMHFWKRNTLISIFLGTAIYMILLRVF